MSGNRRDLLSAEGPGDLPIEALRPGRKIVVTVGINDYRSLPKLQRAVNDACGVQDLLVRAFGFEAPIHPLLDSAATKSAIEALVEDHLRQLLGPDDALILFFAGHGTTRVARLDGVTVETGYIAPVEARGADVFSDLINMEELLRKVGMLPARHILVVLDACHSGLALGSAVSRYRSLDSFTVSLTAKRSRRVITSARRDELALDSGPVPGHSLFTGAMLQGLTHGQADLDGNGIITFSELALFLQQYVGQASQSRQTPDFGSFHLDDRGELILAIHNRPLGGAAAWGPPPAYGQLAPPRRRSGLPVYAVIAGGIALVSIIIAITIGAGVTESEDPVWRGRGAGAPSAAADAGSDALAAKEAGSGPVKQATSTPSGGSSGGKQETQPSAALLPWKQADMQAFLKFMMPQVNGCMAAHPLTKRCPGSLAECRTSVRVNIAAGSGALSPSVTTDDEPAVKTCIINAFTGKSWKPGYEAWQAATSVARSK